MKVYDLRVNSRKNILGLDDERIYFGWKLASDERNVLQESCRITLAKDEGMTRAVWDSGVVMTQESAYFLYTGGALQASTRYFWCVCVTDNHGNSAVSDVQWFETGLKGCTCKVWDGAEFIGSPEDTVNTDGVYEYCITAGFELEEGGHTAFAFGLRDKDNYTAVELDAKALRLFVREYNDGAWKDAIPVVSTLGRQEGYELAGIYKDSAENRISIEVEQEKLSVRINEISVICSEDILPEDEAFLPRRRGLKCVGIKQWDGKIHIRDYSIEINNPKCGDNSDNCRSCLCTYHDLTVDREFAVFSPVGSVCVKKTFEKRKDARLISARLYATAMGFYDVYMNGKKVNNGFYNPGFTDYRKRMAYQTYDVTEYMSDGINVLGAVAMKGYYTGYVGYTTFPMVYGRKNAFLGKLVLNYSDGSSESIVTDGSWRFTDKGPVLYSDYQQGEVYDARNEINWLDEMDVRFGACGIIPWPDKVIPTNGNLSDSEEFLVTAQEGDEAYIERVLKPDMNCVENPKGHFVYDFGQNMVGTVRIAFNGLGWRGTSIKLRYGEMSYPDGRLYIANMRSAANTDCYTMKGDEKEVFIPTGTCHGFRYMEISGNGFELSREELDKLLISAEGLVLTNTTNTAGGFECSNENVNKLQSNIVWGQRGNSLLVYTDCPQRNERMGWTGDAQVFAATAAFNMDIKPFMEKWLTDVRDAQLMYNRDGAVPDTAPLGGDNRPRGGCAGWGDAAVIVPWELYKATGDKGILEKNYAMMKAWIEYQSRDDRQFCGERLVDGIAVPECSDMSSQKYLQIQQSRGDHLTFDAGTPFILSATAYAAYVAKLAAGIAQLLGKRSDARRFMERYENVRKAFNEAWVCEDGSLAYWGEMSKSEPDSYGNIINKTRYCDGEDRTKRPSQTAYALAIDFDLIPEEKMAKAGQCLNQAVLDRDGKLSVGFLGISHLAPALCKAGYYDTAFALLEQTGFPGWLYSVKNGATTIWERWNSYIAETGTFGDVSMNSFNHYSYGAIGEWMYRTIAGIRTDEQEGMTGYKHIILCPHTGGSLTHASAWHESVYGRIESGWKKEDGRIHYYFVIPPNTTATICIEGQPVMEAGSGSYEYTIELSHS